MTVAAAILAAGASRRLGRPKQLLPYRGNTLLGATVDTVRRANVDRTGVILGAHADLIAATLPDVEWIHNPGWPEGIASSIRLAVRWAGDADRLLLCVCDQPHLTTAHLDRLLAAGGTVGSRYAGVVGIPAVFAREDLASLLALTGDVGARQLLATARAIDWPDGVIDVDVARAVLHLTP